MHVFAKPGWRKRSVEVKGFDHCLKVMFVATVLVAQQYRFVSYLMFVIKSISNSICQVLVKDTGVATPLYLKSRCNSMRPSLLATALLAVLLMKSNISTTSPVRDT